MKNELISRIYNKITGRVVISIKSNDEAEAKKYYEENCNTAELGFTSESLTPADNDFLLAIKNNKWITESGVNLILDGKDEYISLIDNKPYYLITSLWEGYAYDETHYETEEEAQKVAYEMRLKHPNGAEDIIVTKFN